MSILGLEIEAAEGSGPTVYVAPGSLGSAGGWVRGSWPIAFSADGPSGACQLAASLAGASVSQPLNEPQSPVTWHQCPAGSFSQPFNTAAVMSGASVPLVMWARDAAYDYSAGQYLAGTATSYVNIDNAPVSVSLAGPTDAPSTAGTQYVTATGSAGPSGVSGIGCSVDNAPYQWYPRATVQVPVAGVGIHRVTCYSANNARDTSGAVATSSPQSWTFSIREPTVSAIGFAKLVNAPLCKRVIKRVTVPAQWVTVRLHHKLIRVRRRAPMKLISVSPSRVAWGGTVRITGQLIGGYLPPGGALVRLRIGEGSSFRTYGVQEHVTGDGRFTTAYTFGAGYAGIFRSFWFQIATLPMGNYPFAPASSGRRSVLVGGHPPPPPPPPHLHKRHRGKHRRR